MTDPQGILDFWIDEVGPKGWFQASDELDATITKRFGDAWERATRGEFSEWAACPTKSLALIILLDQFPRNMFRGSGKSFSSDRKALCCAKKAIEKEFDLRTDEPQRLFYYLPMMHSESLTDQERCVRLTKTRLSDGPKGNLLHAKGHRAVIRQFGRFPYRNDALNRPATEAEVAYLAAGGYAETMRRMQA